MKVEFAFICEGTSDHALLGHLERLCIEAGFDEAAGFIPEFERLPKIGKTVEARLKALVKLAPNIGVVFIHRDADAVNPELRYDEIAEGARNAGVSTWVGVVPVRELESWLLVDEYGIRFAAENPKGRVPLGLPNIGHVEAVARPKEMLFEVMMRASELAGRKREKLEKSFGRKRRFLVERISDSPNVRDLESWRRLRADIVAMHAAMIDQ
jgi:hypothetical protein